MTRTVAFHTFGCKVNQYESEEIRGQLSLGGFEIVPESSPADVYILNSCTVTADADSSCRQLVRKLLREQPSSRILVTGCYAERAAEELRNLSTRVEVFGNREKPMIAMALGVPTACIQAAADQGITSLAERNRAFLKVQDGCDAHCTYCIIPSVRPNLISRRPDQVLREASNLIASGYRELVLTGVRLGRYVHPAQEPLDFTGLLRALLQLPGDFRVRLSSIEVTEIPEAVVELAASHPKMCPFFHIPLQSGDDEVLKRMGRWYTSGQYREQLAFIRNRLPEAAFSADVIVGFPGETEEAFGRTLALLQEEGFSRIHAFRFSVRPGTPAERLSNPVEGRIKSERIRKLIQLDRELRSRYARRFIGRTVRVLLESEGTGYTEHYVRARLTRHASEGSFVSLTGVSVNAEGVLQESQEAIAIPA